MKRLKREKALLHLLKAVNRSHRLVLDVVISEVNGWLSWTDGGEDA